MGDIVNLNRYRKARKRLENSEQAAKNRIRYGQSKTERQRRDQLRQQEKSELDGKRLDGDSSPPDDLDPL